MREAPLVDVRVLFDERVAMRDGVLLSADVFLPSGGGSFPVVLCRTLYSKESNPGTDGARPDGYVGWGMRFVEAGYGFVIQDVRGRYDSDGVWEVYVQAEDGHDTVEWLGAQSWCDGNVGMCGISYVGFTQMHPAILGSEYLKAILPMGATPDGLTLFWQQGAFLLQQASHFLQIGRRTSHPQGMALLAGLPAGTRDGLGGSKLGDPPGDVSYLYSRLPFLDALDEFDDAKVWREMASHQARDEYWDRRVLTDKYDGIVAPSLFMTGWWDCTVHHMFEAFVNWRAHAATAEARELSKLMVGPWTHTRLGVGDFGADLSFPGADRDIVDLHLWWYDQRLRGIDTGVDAEAPLLLYVMGDNVWRSEYEWPLARTEYRALHLGEGGTLRWEAPTADDAPDVFVYDPEDPVPTVGGQVSYVDQTGPRDRSEVQERPDVLVYDTEPLTEDLEVTGPVMVTVYASSTAPDTDFTATLCDLFPDRRAISITEGIIRARTRKSGTNNDPTFMEPGEVYRFDIDLWETSWVFKAGHRIRLDISSSNFPRFDRNTNTAGIVGQETTTTPATQTIYHTTNHPSHITLPTIPR